MAGWEVPSLTPLHGSGGSGGAKRSGPTGGLAKGIPRKVWTPTSLSFTWTRLPLTCPVCVFLMGLAESLPVGGEKSLVVTALGNSYLGVTELHGEGNMGPLSLPVGCIDNYLGLKTLPVGPLEE